MKLKVFVLFLSFYGLSHGQSLTSAVSQTTVKPIATTTSITTPNPTIIPSAPSTTSTLSTSIPTPLQKRKDRLTYRDELQDNIISLDDLSDDIDYYPLPRVDSTHCNPWTQEPETVHELDVLSDILLSNGHV